MQVGNSPVYQTEKRLGKGGFGQVFLGTRAAARRTRTADPASNTQVSRTFIASVSHHEQLPSPVRLVIAEHVSVPRINGASYVLQGTI